MVSGTTFDENVEKARTLPITFAARKYQQEMLEACSKANIILAMETGTGKTHIGVMRMRQELETNFSGLIWFLVPGVDLGWQQTFVIARSCKCVIRYACSDFACENWKASTWKDLLASTQIMISTYQVLLDALRHSFVSIRDISLLVFDEAHHCVGRHPSNLLMKEFYFPEEPNHRPRILGLTASPILNSKRELEDLAVLERNLDCAARMPSKHLEELRHYVTSPDINFYRYSPEITSPSLSEIAIANFEAIEMKKAAERRGFDASVRLTRAQIVHDEQRYTLRQLKTFWHSAITVRSELGQDCCDLFVKNAILSFLLQFDKRLQTVCLWNNDQIRVCTTHLKEILKVAKQVPDPPQMSLSGKARVLLDILDNYVERAALGNFLGIVFVATRACTMALRDVLQRHPRTATFKIAVLVGRSSSQFSGALDYLNQNAAEQRTTVEALRAGSYNLIIATSVAEEGLDIHACDCVVRFDLPTNLISYIQSRGRARKQKSHYNLMFADLDKAEIKYEEWKLVEAEMREKCQTEHRTRYEGDDEETFVDGTRLQKNDSTGALLTTDSAIAHMYHFCSTVPKAQFYNTQPLITLFRAEDGELVQVEVDCNDQGPFIAEYSLPSSLPPRVRKSRSLEPHRSKQSAKRDAAFEACLALQRMNLLDERYLPHERERIFVAILSNEDAVVVPLPTPWKSLALHKGGSMVLHTVVIRGVQFGLILASPIPQISNLLLYDDQDRPLNVEVRVIGAIDADEEEYNLLNTFTNRIFRVFFSAKIRSHWKGFAYLWCPISNGKIDYGRLKRNIAEELIPLRETSKPYLVRDSQMIHRPLIFTSPVMRRVHYLDDGSVAPAIVENDVTDDQIKLTVVGKTISTRRNFLIFRDQNFKESSVSFDLSQCMYDTMEPYFLKAAVYLPSVLQEIASKHVIYSARDNLLPFVEPCWLQIALTTPEAQANVNYERLETLGDIVLKFVTTIKLIAENPTWHEGYLAMTRDSNIHNAFLFRRSREIKLEEYALREKFTAQRWNPIMHHHVTVHERKMGAKPIADLAESVIGAAYKSGGLNAACSTCSVLGIIDHRWKSVKEYHEVIVAERKRFELYIRPFPRILQVETMLGYTFNDKTLMIEALTHPSAASGGSYERLEFLGDAVLDMVVVGLLFDEFNLRPTDMFDVKALIVSTSFLSWINLSYGLDTVVKQSSKEGYAIESPTRLYDFLSGSIELTYALSACVERYQVLADELAEEVEKGHQYRWEIFARVEPVKVLADMVESLLGAIFIDAGGDEQALKMCQKVLENLGLIAALRRYANTPVKYIQNPVRRLGEIHYFEDNTFKLSIDQERGYLCQIFIWGEYEIGRHYGATRDRARCDACVKLIAKVDNGEISPKNIYREAKKLKREKEAAAKAAGVTLNGELNADNGPSYASKDVKMHAKIDDVLYNAE